MLVRSFFFLLCTGLSEKEKEKLTKLNPLSKLLTGWGFAPLMSSLEMGFKKVGLGSDLRDVDRPCDDLRRSVSISRRLVEVEDRLPEEAALKRLLFTSSFISSGSAKFPIPQRFILVFLC